MKKLISLLLVVVILLTACNSKDVNISDSSDKSVDVEDIETDVNCAQFTDMSGADFLTYVEDEVYAGIEGQLLNEKYQVENVDAIYISQEYIDELEFNSQENIFFGYKLSELDAQYEGTRYIFTTDDNGNTVIKAYEKYDDTYEKILRNVAIGTGVIVICATISIASAGVGAPAAVNMVFMASAKTAAAFALSSGAISATCAAIVTGVETENIEETMKAAAVSGSESYKWGAITGAVTGGASKAVKLIKSARSHPTPRQSEIDVLERYKRGEEQVAFKDKKRVNPKTEGSTRPDIIVKNKDNTVKAIEVKNYNLKSDKSRNNLYQVLKKQVSSRVENLPKGSTQEIVLDVRGRGFSKELIKDVTNKIQEACNSVYKDIPVTVMGY